VVHTLTVVTEAHLGLAETNSVLASANAIVRLQLSLVDALKKEKEKVSIEDLRGVID
jgi:hypothetical protein